MQYQFRYCIEESDAILSTIDKVDIYSIDCISST